MAHKEIIIIAVGKIYLNFAINLSNSLVKYNNLYPIKIIHVSESKNALEKSREIKTQLYHYTKASTALFLDADIICTGNIANLWNTPYCFALSNQALIKDCNHISKLERIYTLNLIPEDLYQYNTGVFVFNSNNSKSFFDLWHKEWLCFKKQDQLALVRAHQNSLGLLNKKYNSYYNNKSSLLKHYSGLYAKDVLNNLPLSLNLNEYTEILKY